MDWIKTTSGDREEGGIFYIIQDFSGATALLPGSKDQLWASEYKSFCFRKPQI